MAFLVLKVSQLRILTTASFLAVAGMICILFRIWEVCIPNGTCCAQDHPAGFPSITDTSDHNDRGGLKQLGPHTGPSEYTDSPHCKIQHFFQVFILNSSSVGDRYWIKHRDIFHCSSSIVHKAIMIRKSYFTHPQFSRKKSLIIKLFSCFQGGGL